MHFGVLWTAQGCSVFPSATRTVHSPVIKANIVGFSRLCLVPTNHAGNRNVRKINNQLLFSATDLTSFLGCHHAIELDRAVAEGKLAKVYRADSTLELLKELGDRHETNYLNHLRASGRQVVELARFSDTDGGRTLQAMNAGVATTRARHARVIKGLDQCSQSVGSLECSMS